MSDLYLYDDVPVLRNKLGIKNEKALDLVKAEQSRANMMLLYARGLDDFSPDGLRTIHRTLFEDVYEWAGEHRIINIEKREKLLAGRSVWYSNDEYIPKDLKKTMSLSRIISEKAKAATYNRLQPSDMQPVLYEFSTIRLPSSGSHG